MADDSQPTTPLPGSPVRGSETGRPIMALLDLLGRRWTLRILWELSNEPAGFRALQRRCDNMSSSMLHQRLGELRESGFAANESGPWELTELGAELLEQLASLYLFAEKWQPQ